MLYPWVSVDDEKETGRELQAVLEYLLLQLVVVVQHVQYHTRQCPDSTMLPQR
jgi:hypothetical protein